ncbi:MAG: sigma-70 family RNA polymerase sigma factor [Planctomycetota bacterium]
MPQDTPAIPPDHLVEHAEFLRRLARRLVTDDASAEDVVQDTMVAAITHPPKRAGSLRPWLATITRRLSLKSLRREQRRSGREFRAAKIEATSDAVQPLMKQELLREVVEAVLALKEPYRSTILMRYYENLPPREIAARQGAPIDTVNSRLSRAAAQLRRRLDRSHGNRSSWSLGLVSLVGLDTTILRSSAVASGAAVSTGLVIGKKSIAVLVGLVVVVAGWTLHELSDESSEATSVGAGEGGVPEVSYEIEGRVSAASAKPVLEESQRAEATSGDPVASSLAGFMVSAVVLDKRTGAPIEGAQLALVPQVWDTWQSRFDHAEEESPVAWSDASGRVTLENVPAAIYRVSVWHRFYSRPGITRLRIEGDTDLGEIRLPMGGVIVGSVVSSSGGKPAEARVSMLEAEWVSESPELPDDISWGDTDVRDGRFELLGLPAGRFRIQAMSESDSSSNIVEVTLEAGEVEEVRLSLRAPGSVRGWVMTPAGEPAASADVRLTPFRPSSGGSSDRGPTHIRRGRLDSPSSRSQFADSRGYFEIAGVPEGKWEVHVRYLDGLELLHWVEVLSGEVSEIRIEPASDRITGRVVDGDGRPVEDVKVSGSYRPDLQTGGHDSVQARTDSDGHFELPAPIDGLYSIFIREEGFVPVGRRVRSGANLELRLERVASISGSVVLENGEPAVGAGILVGGRDMLTDAMGIRFVKTDDTGRFHISPVKAGFVELWAGGPGFTTAIRGVTVEAGEDRDGVVLEVGLAGVIEGVVLGPDGSPVPEVSVSVPYAIYPDGRGAPFVKSVSDAEGRIRLTPVDPGIQPIVVSSETHAPMRTEVTVSPGGTTEVELRLEAPIRVFGTLRNREGVPIEDAEVRLFDHELQLALRSLTDSEGRFQLEGLATGDYEIQAFRNVEAGRLMSTMIARRNIVLEAGENDIQIDLTADVLGRGSLRGRVLRGEKPVAGVGIGVSTDLPMRKFQAVTKTDSEGRFALTGLPAGAAVIGFVTPEEQPGTSYRPIDLHGDDEIEIRLPDCRISGRIAMDDNLARLITIIKLRLVRDDVSHLVQGEPWQSLITDPEESWSFEEVEPGRYTLIAIAEPHGMTIVRNITLEKDQAIDLGELSMGPSGTLALRARGDDGAIIPGLKAWIQRPKLSGHLREAYAYVGGRSTFDHLPPGRYDVVLEQPGYRTEVLENVPVVAGQSNFRDVVLERIE